LTEPTYFDRDRYDLPLPLIRVNPNFEVTAPSPSESLRTESISTQQQLIAQALARVLNPLGVRFKFSIQRYPQSPASPLADTKHTMLQSPDAFFQPLEYRLRVMCRAHNNLDCQLIAEPLARSLRQLDLQGFQEAIVEFSQAVAPTSLLTGVKSGNWRLKLDLTPPSVLLKSWARWGDVQSITKLLNLALAPVGIQVSSILKNLTLQIFCTLKNPHAAKFPTKKIALDLIAPLTIELAPQGIQGATIHGVHATTDLDGYIETSPAWKHWLDLPALGDPKFSPTPIILAARGDEHALRFILERLLNPDLERCLAIGGINLSLMLRNRILYVMSEAPVCPIQSQVSTTIIKVLRQLALPNIGGVRIHGRISGQIVPLWTYGVDFDKQTLELPPVAPEHQFKPKSSVVKIGWERRMSEYLAGTGIWKPQFAMDKTDRLVYQPKFKWQPSLLWLVVGIGLVGIGDLAIKFSLASNPAIADAKGVNYQLSFNNSLLEQKLAQYQLRCLQQGVPDVLIVGSSRALRGVNPEVLQRSLTLIRQDSTSNSRSPQIYNFGINGATAKVVDLILRQLLTSQQLPKLVIWADGARAFNSGKVDRTYETIAASDRYQQLAIIADRDRPNSSLFQVQSTVKTTYQAIDDRIDRSLVNISPAYAHRDLLKTWLQTKIPTLGQLADSPNLVDLEVSINDRDIDNDGFLALEAQFDPNTYYQKYTKVTGYSDADYANFQLLGSQDRALQQITDLLAVRKIPLVFVNMPLSDIYLDKIRRQHETNFKQYMQTLMEKNRLTFIDMDGFLNKQYDRFSDPSHLNQLGASEVSRYLGQTTSIPWQKLELNLVVGK
jgi:hypothetical protein